jgi:hypothetical protein
MLWTNQNSFYFIIPLVHRVVQNEETSDDNVLSVIDYEDENFSEGESSDSDNEVGKNQEFNCKSDTSDSERSDRQVTLANSGWEA